MASKLTKKPDEIVQDQTGTASSADTGDALPATGTAGATADAAGGNALAADAAPKLPEDVTLVIIGPEKGRWRIGRQFGREPVAIQASELTVSQIEQLRDDPQLSISIVQTPY